MSRVGENIYKRKDGRWEGRYIKNKDARGRYHYGYVYAKKYCEVKEKLAKMKALTLPYGSLPNKAAETVIPENGLFTTAENRISISEFAQLWLESVKNKVKQTTYNRYYNLVHLHIIPGIGSCGVSELTNHKLEGFIEQLQRNGRKDQKGGLSGKMIADILLVVKRILRHASLHQITVVCIPELVGIRYEKKKPRILTSSEQQTLSNYLLQHPAPMHLGILLCLYTGLRVGELCALRWEHISQERCSLMVCGTLQRIQNTGEERDSKTSVILTQPKSCSSVREIPLNGVLMQLCAFLRQAENSYVLTGNENYLEPRRVEYYYTRLLHRLKIPHTTVHALRHTFATRCVESGVEIKSLSEILGHSNINITLDRYVHSSMELKRINIEKLLMLE